jgi:putative hydrolase of the HAD superfamily
VNQAHQPQGHGKAALLLDFGGVCLLSPVELHRHVERVLGLPEGTLTWMGPVDPSTDPLWRALLAEEISERDYWHRRADELGKLCGRQPFVLLDYLHATFDDIPESVFIRPAAVATVARARAAGKKVGILTNDLEAFHGPEWVQGVAFLRGMDSLTDASKTGILKPDPRAYEQALAELGVGASDVLFVDDQPRNVNGARAYGLETIAFDMTRPDESWRDVERALLGDSSDERRA